MSRARSALLTAAGVSLLVAGLLCAGFGYWFVGLVQQERALRDGARQHVEAARRSGDQEDLLRSLLDLADHSGNTGEAEALVEAAEVALALDRKPEALAHLERALKADPSVAVTAELLDRASDGPTLRRTWLKERIDHTRGLSLLPGTQDQLVWNRSRSAAPQTTLDPVQALLGSDTLRLWAIEDGSGTVGDVPVTYWLLTAELSATANTVVEVSPAEAESARAALRACALCWWWHASSTRDGFDELLINAIATATADELVDLSRNETLFDVSHDNGITEGELIPSVTAEVGTEVLAAMHKRLQPGTLEGFIKAERLDLQLYRELGYELERRGVE